MSVRNALVLLLALSTLSLLVGCGSGTAHTSPPPSGGFSDTSLNGTYSFLSSGRTRVHFRLGGSLVASRPAGQHIFGHS